MRYRNWIVVMGLAVVGAASPGCNTAPIDDGRRTGDQPTIIDPTKVSPYAGVVEIYRTGPTGGVIGYVSTDPTGSGSWWLLSAGATPPVMPMTTPLADIVEWRPVDSRSMNGTDLCAYYDGLPVHGLSSPRMWHVHSDPPFECVH